MWGVDQNTGLLHRVEVTGANVHDVTVVPQLLAGEEEAAYGDSGYLGAEKREDAVTRREREKPSVHAKEEHVFAVVKDIIGVMDDGRLKNVQIALTNVSDIAYTIVG